MDLMAEGIKVSVDRATCHNRPEGEKSCKRIWGGSQRSLGMLLIEQAISESTLSHLIHDNQCRLKLGECDAKRKWNREEQKAEYIQQSFSPWQIKFYHDIPQAHWDKILLGRPGTTYAAWHATRRLASGYTACGNIQGAIARYTTGGACKWEKAPSRYALYRSLMSRSEENMKKRITRHETAARKRTEQRVASKN